MMRVGGCRIYQGESAEDERLGKVQALERWWETDEASEEVGAAGTLLTPSIEVREMRGKLAWK
jgi:hypothetical protein